MTGSKIILLACGAFNPPTNMHLRMFEIARDHLNRYGTQVIGGIISPVHDGYGKADLLSAEHRLKMLELALDNCDWIKLSDWETRQESWQRTRASIQYHQNRLNSLLNSKNLNENDDWFTDNINGPVQVKLLCGADLLESFATPGLWSNDDIEAIVGRHGLVVITRENTNPEKFIYNSDILTKYMANIIIVTEWIKNEVSSTKIRRALRRDDSVKYLIPDSVIDYIRNQGLYGCKLSNTPSPIDVPMDTPSPTPNHRLPCMNMCNNNNHHHNNNNHNNHNNHNSISRLSIDVPDNRSNGSAAIVDSSVTGKSPSATSVVKPHPGQAVKVVVTDGGQAKVTVDKKVRAGDEDNVAVAVASARPIKASKSCVAFERIADGQTVAQSKSNDSLDCKSCDENLIKFIFTKHGIQVISDVETIV